MRSLLSGICLLSCGQLVAGLQFVTLAPSFTAMTASTIVDRSVYGCGRHLCSATSASAARRRHYSSDKHLTLGVMVELSRCRLRNVLQQQRRMSTDATSTSLTRFGGVFWNGPATLVEDVTGERVARSAAALALPLLNRFFNQASQLFQVGVLMGPLPTVLAACVTAFWAWQVRRGCVSIVLPSDMYFF